MPKYDIKRGAAIIASVIAEGNQNVEAMGVNEVSMKFTLITPVMFQVGDWCQVYGNKYVVYRKPEYTKVNERQHEYDLYLVHEFYRLQNSLLMGIDKNATLNEKIFDLTGNLQAFADLVLLNANRNDSGWTLGTVDTTDAKTLQFDGENILASLNRIASEFETEFWIEGKTISFAKRLTNSGITLSYGENKGLISLTKGNKDANATIFTRLFVEGAERNLPSYTNYGFKRLQLPSANNGKVDNTSAIASFGVIEHYAKFDDIYPKHTGTITSVGDEFTFYDSALPFNINDQLLPGVTAYVAFQSGVLAGYNFDIASFDNATKKFVININEDEKTVTLPNATLKPAVGDTYIVFDIQMPATHITTAENELLAKATELLAQGSDIDFNDAFSGNCDPLYFKRNSITPVLGQYARLFETNPAIDVTKRMSKISRDLQNSWKYDITFTDKIQVNTVVREYIKEIEDTLVINETINRVTVNREAVRRAAQRIDTLRGDVFDPDGYFSAGNYKPETLETIMATFGYKSGSLTLEGASFNLNVGANANDYNFTAGKLIHFVYDVAGGYTWVIPALTSSFVDSNSGYYIYAKCSKTTLTGTWVVNNSKLQVDNETGYYTLLIGRVYPVVSGKREVDLLYGITNIVGNRIQAGIIQDLTGTNFWNLETGQMKISGQVTIGAGSNVYTKTEVDGTIQDINDQIIVLDGQLANYASDGVLNGIAEKQPIKIAYDAAANEVEDLKTQAAALGVSSLDYNAAFINLQNIVLPLLADLTSVSVVDGVQLRDKFNYYGAQKSLLVKNIQAANVNNISRVENYSEINLLTGSKPGKRLEPSENYTSNHFSVTAGKTYSIAVNTTVSGSAGRVIGWVHPQWAWYFSPPQNNTYGVEQTRTVTFNAPSTADNVIVQLQNDNAAGGVVVNWITVVEGGKPMLHWQPNIAETSVTLYNSTNLLKNSNFARGFDDWLLDGSGHTIETDPEYGNVAKLAYGQAMYANLYPGDTSQEVTVSLYAKGSAGAVLMISSYPPLNIKYPGITANWERYYVTFKWNSGWELGMKPLAAGMTIWLANIQVEAGAAVTAYKVADGDLLKISSEIENKAAKLITLTGATQIITVSKTGVNTPASAFTIVGTAQNTTINTWEYSVNGVIFTTTEPAGVSRTGDTVTINPAAVTFRTLTIRASNGTQQDTFTVARAFDGVDGTDGQGIAIKGSVATYAALPSSGLTAGDAYLVEADGLLYIYDGTNFPTNGNGIEFRGADGIDGAGGYAVLLTNESHTFAGNETNALAGATTCDVITYKGTTAISHTISVGTLPTGLSASVSGSTITFTASTSLTTSGTVDITIVADGQTFVKKFSFAVSFKGVHGKSVTNVDVEFAKTTSPTVAPTIGWATLSPAWEQGYYIWSRTVTTFSDYTTSTTPAVNLTGAAGSNGQGVSSITEEYYLSTSNSTQTGGSWSTTVPTWVSGKYIWTRTKVIYTDPVSTVYSAPVLSQEFDAINTVAAKVDSKITFWSSLPTTGQYKVNDLWRVASTVTIDGVQFIAGKVYKCVATGVFFSDNWKIEETISSGSSLPPTNTAKLNDLFINESDSNKVYVFNGTSWVVKADSRIQEALDASNNAAKIFRGNGSSLPTNYKTGNLFVPTTTFSSGGRQFVGGATYQAITDSATFSQAHWIALSSEEAKQALNEAATKTTIITSASAPSGSAATGTIWQRTYVQNGIAYVKYYRYNGSSWVEESAITSASYLENALKYSTEIAGGLTLTHVVGVKNGAGVVKGYINGEDGNINGAGIMTAMGVTNFGQTTETQKGVDRHDGSGFRSNGKIWWDKDGNARIGAFYILSDRLATSISGERMELLSANNAFRGYNSGGNLGFELKAVNGLYSLVFYAPDGSVAYKAGQSGADIPERAESYTAVGMYLFTGLPSTYSPLTNAQKETASNLIKTNSSRTNNLITVSLSLATKYLYDAGNNVDTPIYAVYAGYKNSNSSPSGRTDNVANGWYAFEFSPSVGAVAFYELQFVNGGKIVAGSSTTIQISYLNQLVFVTIEIRTVAAGAKDRHYAKATLSQAINDTVEVYWTITDPNNPSATASGEAPVQSGQTATTNTEAESGNYLETSPTVECSITINGLSLTTTTAVSDGLERTLTY